MLLFLNYASKINILAGLIGRASSFYILLSVKPDKQ